MQGPPLGTVLTARAPAPWLPTRQAPGERVLGVAAGKIAAQGA